MIAGKGHEQGQEFAGGRKEPFDDVAVAREALRAVGARVKHWSDAAGRRARRAPSCCAAHPDGRAADGPTRVVIDSREVEPGRPVRRASRASSVDGGSFAAMALAAGAWGVLVTAGVGGRGGRGRPGGAVLLSQTPTAGARARWRGPGGATWPRT